MARIHMENTMAVPRDGRRYVHEGTLYPMAGLYPDTNEDPQLFLDRLRRKEAAGRIRDADRPIFDAGIAWATAEIEKKRLANSDEPDGATDD